MSNKEPLKPGWHSIVFNEYEPLKDHPPTVYFYIPPREGIADLPVLIHCHGAGSGGGNSATYLASLADEYGLVLIAPAFPFTYYGYAAYQFGGVSSSTVEYIPTAEESWVFSSIEPIFEHVKSLTGNTSEGYYMYGHSGGGQFVHRYLSAMPEARVIAAAAGNPGHWTIPAPDGVIDDSGEAYPWPDTVMGTPFASDYHLRRLFGRKLYVLLGDKDTGSLYDAYKNADPSVHFMISKGAMAEGPTRYARGLKAFEIAQKTAEKLGCDFNWELSIIPGVGHQAGNMFWGTSTPIDFKAKALEQTHPDGGFRLLFPAD